MLIFTLPTGQRKRFLKADRGAARGSFPQAVTPGPPARKGDVIMARRTKSGKQAADILERLASEEAVAVLHLLLGKHPELRPEVEGMAKNVMSSISIEDIAADVFSAVTGVDLEALHGRAGKHSWGYVEPNEAAWELLEEALDDWVDDMKRKVEADMLTAAQGVCVGIIAGLYNARNVASDGMLNLAPDFPAEHAGYVVQQFVQLCRYKMNAGAREHLLKTLTIHAPGWEDVFHRVAEGAGKA